MAKFCGNCGNELKATDKVCEKCGAKITLEQKTSTKTSTNTTAASTKTSGQSSSNGLAIAGFVLSIISLMCCGTTSILGLIFSIVGLVNSNKNNDNGKGLAIAGIIISSISVLILILFMMFGVLAGFYDSISSY